MLPAEITYSCLFIFGLLGPMATAALWYRAEVICCACCHALSLCMQGRCVPLSWPLDGRQMHQCWDMAQGNGLRLSVVRNFMYVLTFAVFFNCLR